MALAGASVRGERDGIINMPDGQMILSKSVTINNDFGGSNPSLYIKGNNKSLHRVPEAPFGRYTYTSLSNKIIKKE